jgi:Ca2+/H+ antiporter, TMEM165/GDT1 family
MLLARSEVCTSSERSLVHAVVVALTTFVIVFPAELPDKTAIAGLLLGSRYKPLWVLTGVSAAFTLHVILAVTLGSLVGLLPRRPLEVVVALIFAAGAVLLLRGRHDEELKLSAVADPSFWRVAATGFVVILVAEFGDLTQIVTASLAARFHEPVAVGIGALTALIAVAALAIGGGRALLRVLPMRWITRACSAAMIILAGFSLTAAIRG